MTDQTSRLEDMSPDGKLVLLLQPDGDVIVNVRPSADDRDYEGSPFGVSVEFCASGGRSPKTLKALRHLFEAMKEENKCDSMQKESQLESP